MSDGSKLATAFLGLGSNLGDREANLRAAVDALVAMPGIDLDRAADVASLYETSPVGGPGGQAEYLNSVVRVRTSLSPQELLQAVLTIERELGRVRRERWAEREIDIDLLLYGNIVVCDKDFSVPHPRMHSRRFVLEPLAEIAPDFVHPFHRGTIAQLADRLRAEPTTESVTRIARPTWSESTATRHRPVEL